MLYTDELTEENTIVRTFIVKKAEIGDWHRDKRDRIIEVLESDDTCLFQFDNGLPLTLYEGVQFRIPAMQYHRIFINSGKLKLRIQEL